VDRLMKKLLSFIMFVGHPALLYIKNRLYIYKIRLKAL
jgi:hypothetical protein